jgi:GntR family transcriptional regulator
MFRSRIESGNWAVGAQIPTVEDLSIECGVAKATIRQALGLLEEEGLVSRYRAKGTYVNKRPHDLLWLQMETDWNGLLTKREGVRINVLSEEKNVRPTVIPHRIGELATNYRYLRRLHCREEAPFMVADVYMDETYAKKIKKESFSEVTSLQLISSVPGVEIIDAKQTLTIGTSELDVSELLQMPVNSPIAKVQRTAVDVNGNIVMISNGIYRGDIVRIDMEMKP